MNLTLTAVTSWWPTDSGVVIYAVALDGAALRSVYDRPMRIDRIAAGRTVDDIRVGFRRQTHDGRDYANGTRIWIEIGFLREWYPVIANLVTESLAAVTL